LGTIYCFLFHGNLLKGKIPEKYLDAGGIDLFAGGEKWF
jgi:hypothetical protein